MRITLLFLLLPFNLAMCQVNLNLKGDLTKITNIVFRRDCPEISNTVEIGTNMKFISEETGIHKITLHPLRTIFVFVKPNEEVDIFYDLHTDNLSFINSIESANLNKIDAAWVQEVKCIGLISKSQTQDYEKQVLQSYVQLLSMIKKLENPLLIDFSTVYLSTLEDVDESIIPITYFLELNRDFRSRFPIYAFPELASILKNRKGVFRDYMWKER